MAGKAEMLEASKVVRTTATAEVMAVATVEAAICSC